MANQKILAPYNFTIYDNKGLDFVIRTFAHLKNIEIALFNAYTPVPEIDMNESPVMEKLKSNLYLLAQRKKEQQDDLETAKQHLIKNGFSERQVSCIFQPRKKDIASEIIALVQSHNFNMVVLNHKHGKLSHFFTGNVFIKVVNALKDITVCVVS